MTILILLATILFSITTAYDNVVFGDSNTVGFNVTPWAEYLPGSTLNCAVGGIRTDNYELTDECLQAAQEADHVYIMLGTNDILAFRTAEEIATSYTSLLHQIGRPDIIIIGVPRITFPYNTLDEELHAQYEQYEPNKVIEEAEKLLPYPVVYNGHVAAQPDGVHMDQWQQQELGERFDEPSNPVPTVPECDPLCGVSFLRPLDI